MKVPQRRVYTAPEFKKRGLILNQLRKGRSLAEACRRSRIAQATANAWIRFAKEGSPKFKEFADECARIKEELKQKNIALVKEVIRLMADEGIMISDAERRVKIKKGMSHKLAEQYGLLKQFNAAKRQRKISSFSDKEVEVFRFIVEYNDKNGRPPKITEVADHFRVSKQAISFLIRNPKRRKQNWKNHAQSADGLLAEE